MTGWNQTLPYCLYEPATPMRTIAMGGHFLTGAILLVLGQADAVHQRHSQPCIDDVHRWLGRLYVLSAGVAGVFGLSFHRREGHGGRPDHEARASNSTDSPDDDLPAADLSQRARA